MVSDDLNDIRRLIVDTAYSTQEGHIASAFSILNILNVLYGKILTIKADFPDDPERDIFILSKGHASIGLYCILAYYNFFPKDELKTFGQYGSILGGHPDKNKISGVEASTGSLGHGFPIAVGMALGMKIKNKLNQVYSLVGDGELNEGSMWEAILLSAEHNLDNLTCIVDYNHSTDRALDISDIRSKFISFNWSALVVNGHDERELELALREPCNKPKVIIANTIKGYGCKRMENNPAWHHRSPSKTEFDEIMEELK